MNRQTVYSANGSTVEVPTGASPCDLPDGNYPIPDARTSYYHVEGGQVTIRNCADCHIDPDNCPDGRLWYDWTEDACLWSHEARDSGYTSQSPF
jgi:hypothetical protein